MVVVVDDDVVMSVKMNWALSFSELPNKVNCILFII
jgi:hypothetical protein